MKPVEESSKGTRKWSRWSLWSNLAAILAAAMVVAAGGYYPQLYWFFLFVDVFVLAGLAFFFKALYDCVRAKTWGAFAAFLPALVLQLSILAIVGLMVWYFWNRPEPTHS